MKIFVQMILILSGSVIIGLVFNGLRNEPLPFLYESIKLESGSVIGSDQASRLLKNNEAIFIDARIPEEFQSGHISGALNISVKWPRSKKMEVLTSVTKEENIVVYCENSECSSAERLAGELKFLGYQHVVVFDGGWELWQKLINNGE